jgi:hypothetical protein
MFDKTGGAMCAQEGESYAHMHILTYASDVNKEKHRQQVLYMLYFIASFVIHVMHKFIVWYINRRRVSLE